MNIHFTNTKMMKGKTFTKGKLCLIFVNHTRDAFFAIKE